MLQYKFNFYTIARYFLGLGLFFVCGFVYAQDISTQEANLFSRPTTTTLGFEEVKLPNSERMGLLGAQYLFNIASQLQGGPALYGAATGQRGGLFTWGWSLQHSEPIFTNSFLSIGTYVGAGGGAGAPVGGGLMLRHHADLIWQPNDFGVGVTFSRVVFPSGSISSNQAGVFFQWLNQFEYLDNINFGKKVQSLTSSGGVGFDRVMSIGSSYHPSASRPRIGGLGARMEKDFGQAGSIERLNWLAGVEALGAATGGTDGYAEGLVSVGAEWSDDDFGLGLRAALGVGGGGNVNTKGGSIGKAGIYAQWLFSKRFIAHAEVGKMRALEANYAPSYELLGLGYRFENKRISHEGVQEYVLGRESWGAVTEFYDGVLRKAGGTSAMKTIGIRLDHYLTSRVYVSGQAHGAFDGGAGAYSIGLVGLGYIAPIKKDLSWGIEFLAGAAGGGGVSIEGGAVIRPGAYLSYSTTNSNRIILGAAHLQDQSRRLDTTVTSVQWLVDFGLPVQ